MKAAGVVVAIAIALALQTTLVGAPVDGPLVDLVLVVVLYVALVGGAVPGLLAGAFGGIAQDALSGGIVGIGGLAKTIVGFLAGAVGSQFIVAQSIPRFLVFFVGTLVHVGIFIGLYAILMPRGLESPVTTAAGQALANAVVGLLVFQAVDLLPGDQSGRPRRRVRR